MANRTVNYEVGAWRGILKQFGLWGPISDRVRALPERHNVGKAVSLGDEAKLILAASTSRSPALPLLLTSIDTGMRASEIQALQHRDLTLTWTKGETAGELVVPKSKTAAGTGRLIPLTRRVCACLTLWLSRFPGAEPDAFVFPFHCNGGNSRNVEVYEIDLTRPMGSWRKAWLNCCKAASVRYRWHQPSAPVLEEMEHKNGHGSETPEEQSTAKSLETNGGPSRIRTWDQWIMSPLL